MASIKYQSRTQERGENETVYTLVYQGKREAMEALQDEYPIGSRNDHGELVTNRLYQGDGPIWCVELKWRASWDGDSVEPPAKAWGAKSATLQGSMLSMPLESKKGYLACWNHYLAGAPGAELPMWWDTATDTVLDDAQAKKYAWIKSVGETPVVDGVKWHILAQPEKPGVEGYDIAVYSVTETAKFRSAKQAGQMVANVLNKIGSPNNNFGISGGNWKCDDATVSWDGKRWLATLTWTRSGDESGWDTDLYE